MRDTPRSQTSISHQRTPDAVAVLPVVVIECSSLITRVYPALGVICLRPITVLAISRNLSRWKDRSPLGGSVNHANRETVVGGGAVVAIIAPVPITLPVMILVQIANFT